MSTPISRHNKLQGLALYAPRHARERADAEEPPADLASAEPPEGERADAAPGPYAGADAGRDDTPNAADIHEWLDQAIREAVDLGRAAENSEDIVPELELAQAPRTAPAQSEADDWPRQRPEPRTRQYRPAAAASPHRPRLEAEIVPEPPADPHRGDFVRLFLRLSLVIMFAALVAYALTTMPWSPPRWMSIKASDDRVAAAAPPPQPELPPQAQPELPPPPPPARLIVQDQQVLANQPVWLPIVVEHGNQHQSLVVDGLVQGTTLSAGAPANASSWRLPSDKLRGLYLYAPKDFVGVMNTTVDLLGSDQRLLDSRAMQLKWIEAQPKPKPALATATADAAAGHPAIGGASAAAAAAVIAPIDPGEAAMLMQRGRDFLSAGDLSAARVAFRRLADAGMADAALALANTYDPDYLGAHNFVGVAGDRATALVLYRRAKQLGSAEATRILAQMAAH